MWFKLKYCNRNFRIKTKTDRFRSYFWLNPKLSQSITGWDIHWGSLRLYHTRHPSPFTLSFPTHARTHTHTYTHSLYLYLFLSVSLSLYFYPLFLSLSLYLHTLTDKFSGSNSWKGWRRWTIFLFKCLDIILTPIN